MAAVDERVLKSLLFERWNADVPNRAVKVMVMGRPLGADVGYVTLYKYIAGRTLVEVEKILGFR